MTLTELTNNGVKVARLAGNRDLNEKAVKAKNEINEGKRSASSCNHCGRFHCN